MRTLCGLGLLLTLTLAARHPELWSAAVDMFGPYNLITFVDRLPESWKTYFYEALGHPERDRDFLLVNGDRPPGLVEIGLVRLAPGASPQGVRDALAARLPGDVLVLTKDDYIRREIDYWSKVSPIGIIFGFGVMIGFGVGAIIVSQILFSDVSDHLPEYATLKAIGYGNLYLYGVVLSQAIILAVLGYLPDGTMVVVNNAQPHVGKQILVHVQSSLQTGAGVIVFADVRQPAPAETPAV